MTDFGIARSLDGRRADARPAPCSGTCHYIAPEQAQRRAVDERTDVYSLGVVLYELLTGDVPFPGDNFVAVAMQHINEPAPTSLERRPDVPLRLASLVERCMAKVPATGPPRWTRSSASSRPARRARRGGRTARRR